jgi:hypothetical protein
MKLSRFHLIFACIVLSSSLLSNRRLKAKPYSSAVNRRDNRLKVAAEKHSLELSAATFKKLYPKINELCDIVQVKRLKPLKEVVDGN